MISLLLLAIPIVGYLGWYYGQHARYQRVNTHLHELSGNYFVGLNYLLNEQPDKAVDTFVKMLEIDSETVETHLALGNLFRRRGELDRAIKVHQNLIARPQLKQQQRMEALIALALDYLRAGMLDRAERLFLEVLDLLPEEATCIQHLLDIYQQQGRWEQAIAIANKSSAKDFDRLRVAVAHYYCELAVRALKGTNVSEVEQAINTALKTDPSSIRAHMLKADYQLSNQNEKEAIATYHSIMQLDQDYAAEVLPVLMRCYYALHDHEGLQAYLLGCLQQAPKTAIILALADYYQVTQDTTFAIAFLLEKLKVRLSLRGLACLVELQLNSPITYDKTELTLLHTLMQQLLNSKPNYRCIQCGLSGKVLHWQCPSCKSWSTVRRIQGIEGD